MSTFSYEDAPEEKVQIYDLGYPLGGRLEVRRARPVQSGLVVGHPGIHDINQCLRMNFFEQNSHDRQTTVACCAVERGDALLGTCQLAALQS